ncbi:MAG TPA: ECF transporter S component [Candidatus Nanopelagicales bacterium]|nr:ECF transporter S component [Candidatus Nanopelagicales bacterium]
MTTTGRAVPIGARSALSIAFATMVGIAAFGWPFLAAPQSTIVAHASDAPLAFAVLIPAVLVVVLAQFADGAMDAKSIAMLGVLSAVIAALRPLGGGVAGIEPIWAVIILGAFAFGPGFGFVLGAVSLFASALVTAGVGPWLPFQMLAAAWIGLAAGALAYLPFMRRWKHVHPWREVIALAIFATGAALAYGLLMNLWFWPFTVDLAPGISFTASATVAENMLAWLRFTVVTSLGFDVPRALLSAGLILVAGRPILVALRRASRRAAFQAPVVFESAAR